MAGRGLAGGPSSCTAMLVSSSTDVSASTGITDSASVAIADLAGSGLCLHWKLWELAAFCVAKVWLQKLHGYECMQGEDGS